MNRFVSSFTLRMDAKGRVVLPEALKTHAGIKDAVAFVGLGNKFQVPALKKELETEGAAPKGQGARE